MKRLLLIMAFTALVISCSKEEEIKASVEITGGNELFFAGNDTIAKIISFTASHDGFTLSPPNGSKPVINNFLLTGFTAL